MADINIAGILRAGAYSPNHIGNDTAIFNATADELRKRGCLVSIYTEEQFNRDGVKEPIILNMCRESESIKKLQKLEDEGRIVINSGYGIENCMRERMTRILLAAGVPHPKSLIVNTNENIKPMIEEAGFQACWIKRGDYHSKHKEDVSFVRHADEAQEVLQEYFYRGITRAVISEHIEGDLIKFYGIRGAQFFFWICPSRQEHDANGWKKISGESLGFDENNFREMCARAAEEVNIDIYGGDCIVDADGSIKIIDFNDWPSFAPCRAQAAPHIAKTVLKIIKNNS
ncbi:MAG: hypothetical protein J6I72_04320 [Muribaculaceae bacterium]|nr:hypothetical protein [Muribaculaceae bacterium]